MTFKGPLKKRQILDIFKEWVKKLDSKDVFELAIFGTHAISIVKYLKGYNEKQNQRALNEVKIELEKIYKHKESAALERKSKILRNDILDQVEVENKIASLAGQEFVEAVKFEIRYILDMTGIYTKSMLDKIIKKYRKKFKDLEYKRLFAERYNITSCLKHNVKTRSNRRNRRKKRSL
ncbi:MAG: hypothetical protein ACTSWR_00780 [Candidatus Helarchaeota archaeon]